MNKNSKKLAIRKDTLRRLSDAETSAVGGGMPPLTFGMGCNTANCMTLGEFCNTHDCRLTFGPCGGTSITICTSFAG